MVVVVEPDKSQGGKLALKDFAHVRDIRLLLGKQSTLHDLCLFRVGIDSVLRGGDLLRVSVSDVQYQNNHARTGKAFKQTKNKTQVYLTLSPATLTVCAEWIRQSGKGPNDFLFTGCNLKACKPLSICSLQRRVKHWASEIGLNPEDYSSRTLRKTKPYHLYHYWRIQIEKISILLGHKDVRSTMHYIGIIQEEIEKMALDHDVFDPHRTKPKSPIDHLDKNTLVQSLHDFWAVVSDVVIDQITEGVFAKTAPWIESQLDSRFAYVDARLDAIESVNQIQFKQLLTEVRSLKSLLLSARFGSHH